jgi:hypothetical protein
LAKCKLDLDHPKFRVVGNASDEDLKSGLRELREKLAKNHTLSGFINQPMKHFPAHHNRVWKWDFGPARDISTTRKGWRLYAYRFDLDESEPIQATAFVCYDKNQAPSGDYAKYLAKEIKRFLAETVVVEAVETRFRRQVHPDGRTISLCHQCYETVAFSDNLDDVEALENTHECPSSSN